MKRSAGRITKQRTIIILLIAAPSIWAMGAMASTAIAAPIASSSPLGLGKAAAPAFWSGGIWGWLSEATNSFVTTFSQDISELESAITPTTPSSPGTSRTISSSNTTTSSSSPARVQGTQPSIASTSSPPAMPPTNLTVRPAPSTSLTAQSAAGAPASSIPSGSMITGAIAWPRAPGFRPSGIRSIISSTEPRQPDYQVDATAVNPAPRAGSISIPSGQPTNPCDTVEGCVEVQPASTTRPALGDCGLPELASFAQTFICNGEWEKQTAVDNGDEATLDYPADFAPAVQTAHATAARGSESENSPPEPVQTLFGSGLGGDESFAPLPPPGQRSSETGSAPLSLGDHRPTNPAPEPGALVLLGSGLSGIAIACRRLGRSTHSPHD